MNSTVSPFFFFFVFRLHVHNFLSLKIQPISVLFFSKWPPRCVFLGGNTLQFFFPFHSPPLAHCVIKSVSHPTAANRLTQISKSTSDWLEFSHSQKLLLHLVPLISDEECGLWQMGSEKSNWEIVDAQRGTTFECLKWPIEATNATFASQLSTELEPSRSWSFKFEML